MNKIKKIRTSQSRGSVLVFTLIILFIILAAAISVAAVTIIERKTSMSTADSDYTFFLADGGAERVLNAIKASPSGEIDSLGFCDNSSGIVTLGGLPSGDTIKVTLYDNEEGGYVLGCTDTLSEIRRIRSVGSYKQTTRAVEVPVIWNQDVTEGLIGYWKFDGNASDSAGNNDGILSGTPIPAYVVAGHAGQALQFNGNNYVQISGLLDEPQSITLTAWVNLTSPDDYGAEVISLGDYAAVRIDETGGFYYNGSDWNPTNTGENLAGEGWHHVAYVIDGANNVQKFYINGVEEGATYEYDDPISYSSLGENTLIGKHGNPSASDSDKFNFNGMIDEVRVYDRPLASEEISKIFNLP